YLHGTVAGSRDCTECASAWRERGDCFAADRGARAACGLCAGCAFLKGARDARAGEPSGCGVVKPGGGPAGDVFTGIIEEPGGAFHCRAAEAGGFAVSLRIV